MSLRRARSHKSGISNIDYRSKKDEENLRIFEPWLCSKDVGTMGYINYKNSLKISRNLLTPTEKINTNKDIANDYPDPRYYTTALFYKHNKIKINTKSFKNSERVNNLEEAFKGKDIFNGDYMKIAEIIGQKKSKKIDYKNIINKDLNTLEERKQQNENIEKLVKDKKKINKNVIQETQLVKINTPPTMDNVINIKKIKEIVMTLRRRYGNRSNINKIFQQWARTFPNKITINDAYTMINSLSIPINHNETKVFITTGSKLGNEFLNLEEFSDLIFNENEQFNSNFKLIFDKKKIFDEKEEKDLINKISLFNKNMNDKNNIKILKDFICQRIMVLNKNLKEISKEKYSFTNDKKNYNKSLNLNKLNYDNFLKGILSLRPPEMICKEEYIKSIFDEYKEKDNLIDMKNFDDNLYKANNKVYLFEVKDNLIDISKEQVNQKRETLKKYLSENKNKKHLIYEKKYDLNKQILLKKEILEKENKEEEKQPKEVNCTIPSKRWLHHIYDNRKEYFNILNRAEDALSAKPNLKENNFMGNTRFSSNPPWRNTAEILVGSKSSATYINEKDRFNIDRDVEKFDKIKKEQINLGRQKRIKTAMQKIEQNNYIKEFLKNEKEMFSNLEKCKRQVNFEELFKNRNFIVE